MRPGRAVGSVAPLSLAALVVLLCGGSRARATGEAIALEK
jgi:hypothetical protein